jgi:DNA adenine methylase
MNNAAEHLDIQCKPILKWAGGKSQLLDQLFKKVPNQFNKYIEPFFGGGALFFALNPRKTVISDSNPELINLYNIVSSNVNDLIKHLKTHKNDKDYFYEIRSLDWRTLSPVEAASRTIFLNKTCFNGLYRVNRKGQFNVPFGNYANPNICDETSLINASVVLKNTNIICGDYKDILDKYAEEGDLIFLDPPYLPVSQYSDFKRYTKEQFYEEDQRELADYFQMLCEKGCYVVLTNSNHPLIHELYSRYSIEVHKTKRYINSVSNRRIGEDVIVTGLPKKKISLSKVISSLSEQVNSFPSTRYMGSKNKILPQIRDLINNFRCESVADIFSGSGVVSYMLKAEGKKVFSNDYMALGALYSKALVENNNELLNIDTAHKLLLPAKSNDCFVKDTFAGLYFSDADNELIDNIRANSAKIKNPYQRAIAIYALTRACLKKRPRGIFTYVGQRYDDGRKDLQLSFEEQFIEAVKVINGAVFDNGNKNKSRRGDAMTFQHKVDLVYMDPPYYSPYSDNEYVRRYHFIEGIACNWEGVEIQWNTKTRKFKNYPTPFSTRNGAYSAFDKLFHKFKSSILVVSYSSNSLPTIDEMVGLLSKYKSHVEVVSVDYKYSMGNHNHKVNSNNNDVKEYLFVGY